jgi:hypothetical protein
MAVPSLPVLDAGASFSTPHAPSSARRARCLPRSLVCSEVALSQPRQRHIHVPEASPAVPLLLAGALCLMAALVAPEQPQDQEAICQRHNGAAACRVW